MCLESSEVRAVINRRGTGRLRRRMPGPSHHHHTRLIMVQRAEKLVRHFNRRQAERRVIRAHSRIRIELFID